MHWFESLDVFEAQRNICSLPIISSPRKVIRLNNSLCHTSLHYIQPISSSPFLPSPACDDDFNSLFLIKEKESGYFPTFLKTFWFLTFSIHVSCFYKLPLQLYVDVLHSLSHTRTDNKRQCNILFFVLKFSFLLSKYFGVRHHSLFGFLVFINTITSDSKAEEHRK